MFSMAKIVQQVQDMQSNMTKIQEELATKQVEGSSGGGIVKVVCTGRQQITSIQIDHANLEPNDWSMLQDLIVASVNDALKKSQELAEKESANVLGPLKGLDIPGLFK